MNVVFHTMTAIAVAVALTDSRRIDQSSTSAFLTGALTFVVGIISHGVLDYVPHCYPINSKIDALLGVTIILATTWLANKRYRLIVAFSFIGSMIPDLIDLAPAIINKQLGTSLPTFNKIFPWHSTDFSGSIYNNNCQNSAINHILLVLTLSIICWTRRTDIQNIFRRN